VASASVHRNDTRFVRVAVPGWLYGSGWSSMTTDCITHLGERKQSVYMSPAAASANPLRTRTPLPVRRVSASTRRL
jgi:hypothetical protein